MRPVFCLLVACFLGPAASLAAPKQALPPAAFIEPGHVLIRLGQTQTFQLLDRNGEEQASLDWSLNNPELADLKVEQGRAVVTVKAAGQLTLLNSAAPRGAEIVVHNGQPPMPPDTRWILDPIDGRFVNALWASTSWGGSLADADPQNDKSAAYYYQDTGPSGSHVRAIRDDGVQVWQWPLHASAPDLRMICGDLYGGVLLQLGDQQSRVLLNLDANGQERWRVPAPGFTGRDFTYSLTGVVYFIEEDPTATAARVVGLDGKTGEQRLWLELPKSQELLKNFVVRDNRLICSPDSETTVFLPLRHSRMMSNVAQVANLAYSEFSLVADSGPCPAGSVLDPSRIHVKVQQRLMMLDIGGDLSPSFTAIEENSEEGPASTTWIRATVPTGNIIVGEGGTGNFLAVRRTLQLWRGTGPGTIENFQYRITKDRTVKYRVPVNLEFPGVPSTSVLGENNLGYTTRGNTITAFNTETGAVLWRWSSPASNVFACAALKDDEVLVRAGGRYIILKDGKPQAYRDELFMLFVMKLRFDFQNF